MKYIFTTDKRRALSRCFAIGALSLSMLPLSEALAWAPDWGTSCGGGDNSGGAELQLPVITKAPLRVGPVAIDRDATTYRQAIHRQDLTANLEWVIRGGCDFPEYAYVYVNGKRDESSKMPVQKISVSEYIGQGVGTFHPYDVVDGKVQFQVAVCRWNDLEDSNDSYESCYKSAPMKISYADTSVDSAPRPLPDNVTSDNNAKGNGRPDNGQVAAAYFSTWATHDRTVFQRGFDLSRVPVENLTHLVYGALPICGEQINGALAAAEQAGGGKPFTMLKASCQGLPDFSVALHDVWSEMQMSDGVQGVMQTDDIRGAMGQMLAVKKRDAGTKIIMSVGGKLLSDPYFHMDTDKKRAVFVNSVKEFLLTWKFVDGINVDWEYPGNSATPGLGSAGDGERYIALLKDLRAMLDDVEASGRRLQLTATVGARTSDIGRIDYRQAEKYLDYLFVKNVDYFGGFDVKHLGHHAGLYGPNGASDSAPDYPAADSAIKALLKQGVPAGKLVLTAATYGQGWAGVHDYRDGNPFTGAATYAPWGDFEAGIKNYSTLIKLDENKYDFGFDKKAKAAYAFDEAGGVLFSFDNPESVKAKGFYVQQKKLGGLMAMPLDGDNGDLLNAMYEGLTEAAPADEPELLEVDISGPATASQKAAVTLDASVPGDDDGVTYRWTLPSLDHLSYKVDGPRLTVTLPGRQVHWKHGLSYPFTVTATRGDVSVAKTHIVTLQPERPVSSSSYRIKAANGQCIEQGYGGTLRLAACGGTDKQAFRYLKSLPGLMTDGRSRITAELNVLMSGGPATISSEKLTSKATRAYARTDGQPGSIILRAYASDKTAIDVPASACLTAQQNGAIVTMPCDGSQAQQFRLLSAR